MLSSTSAQGTNAWTGETAMTEGCTNAPASMPSDKTTPYGRCHPKAHNKNSNTHLLIETHKLGTMLYNPGPLFILGDVIFAEFGDIDGKQKAFVLEAQQPQYYLQLYLGHKVCMSTESAFLALMLMPCKQNGIGHDFSDLFAVAWREITLENIPRGLQQPKESIGMEGLAPPFLKKQDTPATGALCNKLRQQNRALQEQQQKWQNIATYWTKHWGQFFVPTEQPHLTKYMNELHPKGLALYH
jgi:hypothetical protein